MRKKNGFVLCLLASIALLSCDSQHKSLHEKQRPSWLSLCPDFSVTGKAPVEQNAECGHLDVKENPADANSDIVSLNVLRLPAVSAVPEKDPLFIIAGGPGQSATVIADGLHELFNEVRKNRDIVFVDQRGTGQSHPLECGVGDEDKVTLSEAEQEIALQKSVQLCVEKYGKHLTYYTTVHAVTDLDTVRHALGYEKINLWGGSYGSRVVLEYLRRFPAHSRTGVIDGVAPATMAMPWSMEADALSALQKIDAQCDATPACKARFGGVVNNAKKIAARLEKSPATLTIDHPRTQEKIPVTVRAQDFSSILRLALYSRELSSLLPQSLAAAAADDFALFGSLIFLAKAKNETADINYAMHFSVVCSEDYPLYKNKKAEESNVFLKANMVQKYSAICAQWPVGELPADFWSPIISDVPVLILSGGVDPVTPPPWGESVKSHLSQSKHVIAPGGHHIVSQEGCLSQLIAIFIADGKATNIDDKCAQAIQPLAIHVPAQAQASSSTGRD